MLIRPNTDRTPIVFPSDQIPEDTNPLRMHFAADRLAFEDPLQTSVAKSGGITNEGELDLAMLSALEEVANYTEGKDGQPIVFVDILKTPDRALQHVNGYIGILAVGGRKITTTSEGRLIGSIPTIGRVHEFRFFADRHRGEDLYLDRSTLAGENSMPIRGQDYQLRLGHLPERADCYGEQEALIGSEVVEWIKYAIGESVDGYRVFKSFYGLLTENGQAVTEATDCLLQEPFLTMARREVDALNAMKSVVETHEFKRSNIEKMKIGNDGEASLALKALEEQYPDIEIPIADGGDRVRVTYQMGDPTGRGSAEQRTKAINYSAAAPQALLRRADQIS